MDGPQFSGSQGDSPVETREVLVFGPLPAGVERSLRRWDYRTRQLPPGTRIRGEVPELRQASALIVDGQRPEASEILQKAFEIQLPSVLLRAPDFLAGERFAGMVYRGSPGPEEIRRAVNRLVSCPPPSRSAPIPSSLFLSFLRSHFGLTFPPRRSAEVRDAVHQRMVALRLPTAQSYRERLERAGPEDREPDHLLSSLLVQETYLYRTPSHFATLEKQRLPLLASRSHPADVRAWSAGCSTGEEAYSLGALLLSRLPPERVEVIGSDVSRQALLQASQGTYSGYSIRETIPEGVQRWFESRSGSLVASPTLRRRVHFDYLNLATWAEGLTPGPEGDFDVIFCRNVLLYFAPDCSRRILQRMARLLRPGGVLFLGPSETVLGGETELQVRAGVDCFYLEKPGGPPPSRIPPPAPSSPPPPRPEPPPLPSSRDSLGSNLPPWERLKREQPPPSPDHLDRVLARGFRLLDQEDFPAARREFSYAQRQDPRSHGARLGLLFLEANDGNYRLAAAGSRVLAEEGSTLPELFYLQGILADQDGKPEEALQHFQRALFLDPNCLMARLKLAEIHSRTGDRRGSTREAQNLLEQLRNLEPGALVPLSGGFSREALEALCLGLLSDEKGR